MKLDFDTVLQTLDSEDLKDPEGKVVTLRSTAVNALLANDPNEQGLAGEEKATRYELAIRLNSGGEVEISVEEASLIKKLIGSAYTTLVVGQVYKLIN